MKKLANPIFICVISTALGLLCLLARLWLLRTGVQLLPPGHPGGILSWILLAALTLVLIAALVARPHSYSFRPNRISGCAAAIEALCLGLTAFFVLPDADSTLATVAGVVAILAALCSGCMAVFRFLGKRAWLPLYLGAMVTLMLQFLLCFRLWSAESELQRYFFLLGAQTFVLLTVYYRSAAECKMSAPRAYLLLSCAAVFFGFAAVADGGVGYLYGLWALSILLENLSVRVTRRKHHEAA